MSEKPIMYVFIGNLETNTLMCETKLISLPDSETKEIANQVFSTSSKVKERKFGIRSKINSKNGFFYFTNLSPNTFYIALTNTKYSETNIFEMFNEINESSIMYSLNEKGEVKIDGQQYLKVIIDKFQKKQSNIGEINKDLEEIKLEMKSNLHQFVSNKESVENLNKQSEQINVNASVFEKDSKEVKDALCCQNVKLWIIIILIVIVVLCAIIIPIVVTNNNKDNESTTTTTRLLGLY